MKNAFSNTVERVNAMGADGAMRMRSGLFRQVWLILRCIFVMVGRGRVLMVTEMLWPLSRFMQTIGSDHTPAKLKCDHCHQQVKKSTGHWTSITWQFRQGAKVGQYLQGSPRFSNVYLMAVFPEISLKISKIGLLSCAAGLIPIS